MPISTFERREVKFLLSDEQFQALLPVVARHMKPDKYCPDGTEYGIYNLYYDTPDNHLIRTSIEKPYYKEKLRLRSYDSPAYPESRVFLEIKKKIGGIVTKRRVAMTLREAEDYLTNGVKPRRDKYIDNQVLRELDVFLKVHSALMPRQYISYQRAAFFGTEDKAFRLTFDRLITARRGELSLAKPSGGEQLIGENERLMEIKVAAGVPLWMSNALSELGIRKESFSKYGTAYQKYLRDSLARGQRKEHPAC